MLSRPGPARAHPRVLPLVQGRTGPAGSPRCRGDPRYGPHRAGEPHRMGLTANATARHRRERRAKPLPSRSQPLLAPVRGLTAESPSGTCLFCVKRPAPCLLELALGFGAAGLRLGKAVSGSRSDVPGFESDVKQASKARHGAVCARRRSHRTMPAPEPPRSPPRRPP